MTALANSLARAVIDHELPGHAYDSRSVDPHMITASHMAETLDDWLIGDLDLDVHDFIDHMRQFSSFDMGAWLERHRDQINF